MDTTEHAEAYKTEVGLEFHFRKRSLVYHETIGNTNGEAMRRKGT